jgi:hypothetical protein
MMMFNGYYFSLLKNCLRSKVYACNLLIEDHACLRKRIYLKPMAQGIGLRAQGKILKSSVCCGNGLEPYAMRLAPRLLT